MMEALGMQPVPLANSEIFTALQMKTVDGQEILKIIILIINILK